jgi:hypothetical protein
VQKRLLRAVAGGAEWGRSAFRIAAGLVALLLVAGAGPGAFASAAQTEPAVKAATLVKFLSYIEWPSQSFDSPQAPFVIGVMGADDVQEALLDITRSHPAQGRAVVVRSVAPGDRCSGIHMLFVGHDVQIEIQRLSGTPGLLLVSDADGALDRGAMVNLIRSGDHVRFEVAPEPAEKSGVHISSRMLSIAQHVKQGAS